MPSANLQSARKADEVPRLAYRFRQASQIIAFLVATLGLLVLCGWAFNVPTLTYIRPAFQSMKVNTALSFLLLSAGLWLAHDDKQQRSRRILGLVVVAIAGATLVEYAFHVSLGIDQLLFRDTRCPSLSAYLGRMGIATAICFLLVGMAVTFLGTKKGIALQHALVASCFAFSLVALCGYFYGVRSLYSITSFSTLGLHTSAGLFAVCLAYFLARTDEGITSIAVSDSYSGFLLRTLFPAIVVVPILIGWLRLAGQRANLYDTPFGLALMVLGTIGCLTALTVLTVRSMHRLEYERSRAEETVRESEQRFRLVADTAPALIWMSGTDKLCTYFNKPWLDFTGRSMEQELGNGRAEGVHADDLQRCLDTYQQSFDRREKFRMEYRLRRHDGEFRWILDIGVPRYDEDRSFAGYIGIGVDVTDQKLADEARLRHAAIVESSEDAIISKNLDAVIVSWNAGAQRIFGYTESEAVGQPITILIPPELWDEENQILERLRAGGRIEHHETTRVTKSGKKVAVSLIISPIKDSTGRLVGSCKLARDITKRKRAEQVLHETNRALETQTAVLRLQEELLKTFVKNVPAGIAMFDRDMRYLQVSDRWCADYSVDSSHVIGRSHYEVFPHMPERWKEVHRRALGGETLRADEDRWDREGGTTWVRWEVRPWKTATETVGGILILAEDITERKRAEEAVKESETRFRLVTDTAPVMIWMSGLDRKPTYFNQLWLDFTGFSETDLQNRLAEIVHPEDYPQCHEVYCRGFDQRQPFRKECRLRRHDGQYRWMLDIGVPRFHKDGSFAGYIGSCIDITQHKQAEEAISGMTRKLVEAQEQERARIGRELHDDINQRLAMLAVELDHLQDNPSEVGSHLQELRKQTAELSSDVQALSHELHSSKLEYLGVVKGIRSWCNEFGERQKIEIEFRSDVSSTLPFDIGLCLFRVLQEALHNASKYSGVKRIDVQLREVSNEIHLIVTDLGKGFDVDAALQGQGLGITSMRERVRLVNGTIAIDSKPMGGTTVRARVPLSWGGDSMRATG